ncbi:hypothetical protein N7470_010060 [Penicillium chermesinum]|nr:hypothetical protein N7470_010060 [Penicillium chermesinum]
MDDYEYEYHESETESFYLNLDLTSINGLLRPPRSRQVDVPLPSEEDPTPYDPQGDRFFDDGAPLDGPEASTLSTERIQVLGLDTCNPVVSYYNQIFSCSWADQIGTELIFSHPEEDAGLGHDQTCPPLQQGPAFHLIAANSVKLLGRKANIASSTGPALVPEANPPANSISTDSSLASTQEPTPNAVPRRPEPPSHQAAFIQRLQALKAAKGQTDTVRTVMSSKRANPNLIERLNAWARTEAQMANIQSLNERASNGDQEAEDELLQMLRDLDDQNVQSV